MMSSHRAWLLSLLLTAACASSQSSDTSVAEEETAEQAPGTTHERAGVPSRGLHVADASSLLRDEGANDTALTLDGPLPAALALELSISPARPYYSPGQLVQLQPVARDVQGQRILGLRFTYSVTPADAVARVPGMPGRYELLDEGAIAFQVCASPELCASLSLVSDAGSPSLVVSEPEAGAQLGGDGRDEIIVRGSVTDARQNTVWVGPQRVEVDELGRFEATLPVSFGVNHVTVTASDGVSADTQIERDVLWAPSYEPTGTVATQTGLRTTLPDAAMLALGRSFFDDGTPVAAGSAPRSEDVADLLQLVIERAQLAPMLPDPLVDGGKTLLLRVTDVRPKDVSVDVEILDGGIELFVRIAQLEVDTEGGVDLEGTTVSLDGGVTAALSVLANLRMHIEPGAGVKVELGEFAAMLESASSRFAAPSANAVFRLAESSLRNTLEEALRGVLADALVDQLPRVLEQALGSLEKLLGNQHFTLNVAPLPEQTLGLDGRYSSVKVTHGERVRLGLDLDVSTDKGPLHPTARGIAQRVAEPMVETFDSRPLQLALRVDLLNLLLQTLWNGGLLELRGTEAKLEGDLGELLEHVTLSGKLPPVLRAAHPWEGSDAVIELGQVELTFELGHSSRYGLSALVPVDVDVGDGALKLRVGTPRFETWLIESSASAPLSGKDLGYFAELLLVPALEDALNSRPIELPLPSLPVGDLTQLAPSLAGFALSLTPSDDVVVRGDAVIIDLKLIGSVP